MCKINHTQNFNNAVVDFCQANSKTDDVRKDLLNKALSEITEAIYEVESILEKYKKFQNDITSALNS